MKKVFLLLSILAFTAATYSQWSQTAGPRGASIISLTAKSNSVFFAGSFGSGIFRSTNGGNAWVQFKSGLTGDAFDYVWSVLVSGNNVYAGTQNGVMKSTNNGTNWFVSNAGIENTIVFSIILSGTTLYAGTSDGVFKSTNSGAAWLSAGLAGSFVNVLLYSGNSLIAGTSNGMFRSSDAGNSWINSDSGVPAMTNTTSLVVFKNKIYSGTGAGIFFSADNGLSWAALAGGITPDKLYISTLSAEGNYIFAAAGDGIYRNTGADQAWVKVFDEPAEGNLQKLMAVNGMILCGIRSGIMNSDNKGKSWYSVNKGLADLSPNALAITRTKIYASGKLNGSAIGLYLSTDDGFDWLDVSHGISGNVISLAASGNNVYAGTSNTGLFRSTNNGTNWIVVGDFLRVLSLAINDANENVVYAGTGNTHSRPSGTVYKSTDNGVSWIEISTGLTNVPVLALESKGGSVFAGTSAGAFRLDDNGTTWSQIYSAAGVISIKKTDNRVYAVTSDGNVLLSNDNGNTWIVKNSGITDMNITSLTAIYGDYAYIGTPSGVFYTTNAAKSWKKINNGFGTNTNVISLISNDSYVYAGVDGARLWKKLQVSYSPETKPALTNTGVEAPKEFDLKPNYPNPFNPQTRIVFDVPRQSLVRVVIYDISGKIVAEISNGIQSAGKYEYDWNAGGLASGIYFLKMTADGFESTQKLTLIK